MTQVTDTTHKKMPNDKSVLLIADGDAITIDVSKVIQSLPHHELQTQTGTLAGMNGKAVDLVRHNDLVIFETSIDNTEDLEAISNLREELDQKAKLLVVTRDDIPLSQARMLTRAGADDVLTHPFDSDDLREQVERLTSPNPLLVIPQTADTARVDGQVYVVAKSSGGIGGTTVAVNLAERFLDRKGILRRTAKNRVVVVDLDLQFGSVASFLDVEPNDALFQLAAEGTRPDATFMLQSIVQTDSGINVLTAPSRFAPLDSLNVEQVASIIDLLKAEYDFVVVDLPQALVEWVAPVLERATKLLMVTDSSVPAIRQSRRLIDFYTEDTVGLPVSIVISREKEPLIKSSAHREAAKVLERPLNHWIPDDRKSARAAVDRGVPVAEISSRSPLSKAITKLARSLTQAAVAPQTVSASVTRN